MKLDSLQKLYVHELKDLYSAEKQILKALPKMAGAANDDGLKKAFQDHEQETRAHVERLERIFQNLDFKPGGHHCEGMEGLLKEGSDMIHADADDDVRDAGLISAAQRVEHYEMAGYGAARTYAEKLGRYDEADLLQKTLNEEGAADRHLSTLAERRINFEAIDG
jgi:ferritin-like metal-binding protein YciE